MDYNNIKNNDKSFYYYKTNEFATIDLRYYFNFENTKENYIKSLILVNYLLRTNEIYKTQKQIDDKSKELYGLNVIINSKNFGCKSFIVFELRMINPRIIEDNYFLDALDFYKDIMLKPNFNNNNKLDNKIFNQIKEEIKEYTKSSIKNPNKINEKLYFESIIPNSTINYNLLIDIKEVNNIINKISDIDIINFYNEIMHNYVSSFAFGNLLDNELKDIENNFDFKQIDFNYKYDIKDEIIVNDVEIISKETTQSYIYFSYEIKDYKKENSYIDDALNTILCTSMGPIFNIYRDKLGIIYNGYSKILYDSGVLFVKLDIDKNNKQKAIEGLKEVFNILNDENEIRKLLKYTKEKRKELYISNSEDVDSNIKEIENYVLRYDLSEKEKLSYINKLSVENIINQINNLEYKCMYFYKGDKDEK